MSHQSGAKWAKYLAARRVKFISKGRSKYPSGNDGSQGKVKNDKPSSWSQEKIDRERIADELNRYKNQLYDLFSDTKFKNGFINEKQWKQCISHYVGILDDLSVDYLIEVYCTSDKTLIDTVKKEFKTKATKDGLRDESLNGFKWPRYAHGYGSKVRTKGNFDIHHVIPKSWGGGNYADNILPMHADDHYDHKGVHAPGAPLSRLKALLDEYKKKYYSQS